MKILVAEYSPEWSAEFEKEKVVINAALEQYVEAIEHIGSTAVIGLVAKPIIDMMVGLRDFSTADSLVPIIEELNYEYVAKYEDALPYRRFFIKRRDSIITHQIHMVGRSSEFWERHLWFRNLLEENACVAIQYAALKKELSAREWNNMEEYRDAKNPFIRGVEDRFQFRSEKQ